MRLNQFLWLGQVPITAAASWNWGFGRPPQEQLMIPDKLSTFVSFAEFLTQVSNARYEDYQDDEVASEEDFEQMKQHVLYMYQGVRKPKSIKSFLHGEQYVDCIPIEEQPTYYHLNLSNVAEPPNPTVSAPPGRHESPGNDSNADSPLKLGLKDSYGHPITCRKGSIPMTRLTLHSLTMWRTLNDFFSKNKGRPLMVGGGNNSIHQRDLPDWDPIHLHEEVTQIVDNFGGNSWLNLWNPPRANFSLSQQWYLGGSGCDFQSVEGGWQVGDWYPTAGQAVLFIFWNNHNYNGSGCITKNQWGCYNQDCPAFCQKNHNWHLGGIWDHYSTMDGEQWGFEMQWKLYQGNWWLFLKGRGDYEAVGYYPTSIFNGGQLATNSTWLGFGGETTRRQDGTPFPPMGSGQFPAKGWSEAAYQRTIFYIPRDEDDGVGVWTHLSHAVVDAKETCYDVNITNFPRGGDWGTHIYFGGPGGDPC